jgi:ankyrin repeat protein
MLLSRLIEFNDYDNIKKWFENGNTLEPDSKAITYAAFFNFEKITMLLVDKGLNIETRDHIGKTAIEYAALYSNHTFINSLLFYGANVVGNSWLSHKAPLHYILDNSWNVLGDIPKLEKHIETSKILKASFDNNSPLKFDNHSQTNENHLIMLDRIENGLCGRSFLEEMTRFNKTFKT